MSGFGRQVGQHCEMTARGFEQFRRAVILSLFKGVIMDTPVDTGRLRANWQVTVGGPATGTIDRIDKAGSLTVAAILPGIGNPWDTVYLTNNLPYAFTVEYGLFPVGDDKGPGLVNSSGYSKKAPEGMVRRNVARVMRNVNKYAQQYFP